MKRTFLLHLLLCFLLGKAQVEISQLTASQDIFGSRAFIENFGQYDGNTGIREKIHFVMENGNEKILFTSKGLVYEFAKPYVLKEKDLERIEHGGEAKPVQKTYVYMNWVGSNPQPEIVPGQKQSYYYTYGETAFNARAFKTITYYSVYPKVDIEYLIPREHNEGIKYNVIVHPGANVSDVQIVYSGDVSRVRKNEKGDITIKTSLGDIKEHAPVSYDTDGSALTSAFTLKEGVIGFDLGENYDPAKIVTIDPWVTSISSLSTNNYGFDVDYDYKGNTFVYGGYNPFKVACYNNAGSLQWTFNGAVSSQTWVSAPIVSQAGNFAVDKVTSKTYIGQGFANTGTKIIRLDASGTYDNYITNVDPLFQEIWDMCYRQTTGEIFPLGGSLTSNNSLLSSAQQTLPWCSQVFSPPFQVLPWILPPTPLMTPATCLSFFRE